MRRSTGITDSAKLSELKFICHTAGLFYMTFKSADGLTESDRYAEMAMMVMTEQVEKIKAFAKEKNISDEPQIKEAISVAMRVHERLNQTAIKLESMSDADKFLDIEKGAWYYYQAVIEETMDSVYSLREDHSTIAGEPTKYIHNIDTEFRLGDNVWRYDVEIDANNALNLKWYFNGIEENESDPIGTEIEIQFLLHKIAIHIALNKALSFVESAILEAEIAEKAKMIGDILSEEDSQYIPLVKNFKLSAIIPADSKTEASLSDVMAVVKTQLPECTSDNQLNCVARILTDKPCYY